jgi:hypothetical protein
MLGPLPLEIEPVMQLPENLLSRPKMRERLLKPLEQVKPEK